MFAREPMPTEIRDINSMLDMGISIPIILADLRGIKNTYKANSSHANSIVASRHANIVLNEDKPGFLRTPLEFYFHGYLQR